ncbi:AsmA family protein [Spirosoma endophyticum]|uniref:AsmA protein n=1 Tax=Spirosoma endophyticum TaxID=662367 RepID=A0A1I2EWP7_9BACT|nr:AsmA family protein [Spirosoma endophyticum]SFE96886.1 AsmA protein [Spirosoma endophyticum]
MKLIPKSATTLLKRLGLGLGTLFVLVSLLPFLFPGFITQKLTSWTKTHLSGKLTFAHATLSFFAHFPDLTLTLVEVRLQGSAPFEQDTLLMAKQISLGVNLASLFKERIVIDKIFLADGQINVQIDAQGRPNYNVYKSPTESSTAPTNDSPGTALTINHIQLDRTNIVYNDQSIPMLIRAKGVNYQGKGDLDKAVFDLQSNTHIDSVDLFYNRQPYVLGKRVDANLITNINTHSLVLVFAKNELRLNRLPIQFRGKLAFLREGYTMDFRFQSLKTDLQNFTTALPPDLLPWAQKTQVKGLGAFSASLVGHYSEVIHAKPTLQFQATLRNGSIAYQKAPAPVRNLWLDLTLRLPNLNPEKLNLVMDSLHFSVEKDFFNARLRVNGYSQPTIYARVSTDLDLEKWDKALGIPSVDVKGHVRLNFQADGQYATILKQTSLRKQERVIRRIPRFSLTSSLEHGYLKYTALPEPLRDITFTLNAGCPDSDYRHAQLVLEHLQAKALTNGLSGFARIRNAHDLIIDAQLSAQLHLADIPSFYPLDKRIKLAGELAIEARTKGPYQPTKRQFPVTQATLRLRNGTLQTPYYPRPIERLQVLAHVLSRTPTLRSLQVSIQPFSFWFAGQPFGLQAELRNFDNLTYAITSRGTLDVGKLYQLVALPGYQLQGTIKTNLSLQGNERDALAGRYDRLFNQGTIQINRLQLSSDLFPRPFWIRSGLFRFKQEKMWFDQFRTSYGSSMVDLKGYLTNMVSYATKPRAPLRGHFSLSSRAINVDEFMAFADTSTARKHPNRSKRPVAHATQSSGVVLVPSNLAIDLDASATLVTYKGLALQDAHAQMRVDSGHLSLQQTGFSLIGAPVVMDLRYQPLAPNRAKFAYHIQARDFDIKRAYTEIALFRALATSADKAEGLVSLDYQLGGNLDANMQPVYSSLTGGGVLAVRQVKLNGFRLFGSVSSKTGHDIRNPDVSGIALKSTIAHSILTIERTKLRVAGFRPRIEGKVGLDGRLDLKFRLGLPPFGIFGIPMTIRGSQAKPMIHLGKGNQEKAKPNR